MIVDTHQSTPEADPSSAAHDQTVSPNSARRIFSGKFSSLDTRLFLLALLVFVLPRFIALDRWPIYFFTDEAIQTVQAADLVTEMLNIKHPYDKGGPARPGFDY